MASESVDGKQAPRESWCALVFSLLCPGLGHLYAGYPGRGLVVLAWFLAYVPMVVLITTLLPVGQGSVLLMVVTLATLVLYLFAVFDAVTKARRQTSEYAVQSYQKSIVYTALLIVGMANPIITLFLLRAAVLEAFVVPTASMAPNILPGDRLLVNKLRRGLVPKRGDLVVFRQPENRSQIYIKRVVALAGDTVEVEDHRVFLNGEALPLQTVPAEAFALPARFDGFELFEETNGGNRYTIMLPPKTENEDKQGNEKSEANRNFARVLVPEGMCFVMGDHRSKSKDSRHFSFVPLGDVQGQIDSIYWPSVSWSRFGSTP